MVFSITRIEFIFSLHCEENHVTRVREITLNYSIIRFVLLKELWKFFNTKATFEA